MIVSPDPQVPISDEEWVALRTRYRHPERIAVALRLALDLETTAALLEGRSVDPIRIDPEALRWARQTQFVALVRPVDLLIGEAPA